MKSNHQCPEKPSSHLHMPTEVTDPGNSSQENEQYGHTNSAMPCLPEATILLLMSTYLRFGASNVQQLPTPSVKGMIA